MSEPFQHLLSPLQIGSKTLKNRIVFSAHGTMFADENHLPHEREIYYYGDRAKGGAGMIVIGGSHMHPTALHMPGIHNIADERAIPMYRRIAEAVHEHGAVILTQIEHIGRQATGTFTQQPIWAPSATPCVRMRETPKEMEPEDIEELIQYTLRAARVAREGNLDGVELMASQGMLIGQFFSPFSNRRNDEWGGNLENRLRYACRLLDGIRQEVGKDLIVGMKINGDDFTPGGLTLKDAQEIAARLAATGKLDYLQACMGTFHSLHMIVPDQSFPLGGAVYLASGIKEVVNIPVAAVNRINDPVLAEKILADGHADLISMARALICDPEMPRKAREGRLEDIRHCVACAQGCIGRVLKYARMGCVQNAAVGEEKELGIDTLKPAPKGKKVLVVGGGPAGMEAARIAALRGHQVTLYEKEQEVGGRVNLAARAPSREEFGGIVRYLSQQVNKLGVKVNLGVEVDSNGLIQENPDAVVVATGSTPLKTGFTSLRPDLPGIPGADQENVVTVVDVMEEKVPVGKKVVIIDEKGDLIATSVAEFLADKGKEVEIITRLPFVGVDINSASFEFQYQRLFQKGVKLTPFTAIKAISGKTVLTYHTYSQEGREINDVDTIVLVMGNKANDDLYFQLKGKVKELHRIGDCVAPRGVMEAIREGHLIGRKL